MTTIIPIPNPAVAARSVENEAVLLLPEQGQVKVLNEVGARIWQLVDGSRSAVQIAAQISAEYDVSPAEAEADTLAFLQELAERGVLTLKSIG